MESNYNNWKLSSFFAVVMMASSFAIPTYVVAEDDENVEEVVTIGTRSTAPRTAADSAVPIDVLRASDVSKTGTTDMLFQLAGSVPSLNVHLQPISDAASMIRPANLRGLSSDSTLIFTNGKRRHHAAVIAFQGGGVNDGSQGADISVFPSLAVKQIDVLRDGASAQYGSDAVAGVINFVLDDANEGFTTSIKHGQYTEGDGDSTTIATKVGMPLTPSGDGHLTLTYQVQKKDDTSRSVQRPDAAGLKEGGNDDILNPAQIWGAPLVDDDHSAFINSGLDLDNGMKLYFFGNYSERFVDGGFYYRNPNNRSGVFTSGDYRLIGDAGLAAGGAALCSQYVDIVPGYTPDLGPGEEISDYPGYDVLQTIMDDPDCYVHNETAPGGYTPRFSAELIDSHFAVGVKGELAGGFNYDVSYSKGKNEADFFLKNTVNPSFGPATKRDFYTGRYTEEETFINVDLQKQIDTMSVAFGLEVREEVFSVEAGEYMSYAAGPYALQGFNVGSHGFAGFSPDSAGNFARDSVGMYVDVENQLSDELLVAGSVRYEDYDDFGDTTDAKVAVRYQLSDTVALRGSASTGFRAPTQGQANVVNTQTTLVGGQLTQAQTLPGYKLGQPYLTPEEATNIAMGVVYQGDNATVTFDYFEIELEDRISLSSNRAPTAAEVAAMTAAGVQNANLIGQINFFTNDFDTKTTGFDLVATMDATIIGREYDVSIAWNHTDTEVTDMGVNVGDWRASRLEDGLPDDRMTLTFARDFAGGDSFVRVNYYGEYYAVHADWFGQTDDAAVTVDAEVSYALSDVFNVSLGVQNLFDQTPLEITGSQAAIDEGCSPSCLGAVYYETSPYGIDGAFWYVRMGYDF